MSEDSLSPEMIAQQWLDASARTATEKNFEGHFDLISRRVRVTGVPGFESIGYDDWARASEKEFKEGVLDRVSYDGFKMTAVSETQVMFKTVETIFVNDGTRKSQGVEIVLQIEGNGTWRAIQQRVMSDDESKHVGLM